MEVTEDVVIVGAGLAGLSTSLGLHRLGIRSLVLETSESLRVSGFALTVWSNAWKALEALGIAESLRQTHTQLQGFVVNSTSGEPSKELLLGTTREKEARCVQRKLLLETLAEDLPEGTIRFGSKVVGIEESGFIKLVHLADGTTVRTKVLVGCDGVNSVVGKWLGFQKPASTGRSAIRGFAHFKDGHGFQPKVQQFFGHGLRSGFIPCDHHTVYWFITYYPNQQDADAETSPENKEKMKRFVLDKLRDLPDFAINIVEITSPDDIVSSPLKYRPPWEILFGNITKHNVCVAGDALHPMTPDIGQGGCSALEDGVVLARCLGRTVLSAKQKPIEEVEEGEYRGIEMEMKRYSKERKWRSIDLVSTAYVVGFLQQRNGKMMNVLRDLFLSALLAWVLLKKSGFDCGKLH